MLKGILCCSPLHGFKSWIMHIIQFEDMLERSYTFDAAHHFTYLASDTRFPECILFASHNSLAAGSHCPEAYL